MNAFRWGAVPASPFDWTSGATGGPIEAGGVIWLGSPHNWWVVGGRNKDSSVTIASSPDGLAWTTRGNPFDTGSPAADGVCTGFGYSPSLDRLVAVGTMDAGGTTSIATSDDGGATWTSRGNPADSGSDIVRVHSLAVDWSPEQNQFVAVGENASPSGYAAGTVILTSPDGITWTQVDLTALAFYSGQAHLGAVVWVPSLALWVAGGSFAIVTSGNPKMILTSPDGVTWNVQTTPIDGSFAQVNSLLESAAVGELVAGTSDSASLTSPDATSWAVHATAGSPTSLNGLAEAVGLVFATAGAFGTETDIYSGDDGSFPDSEFHLFDSSFNTFFALAFSPTLRKMLAVRRPSSSARSAMYLGAKTVGPVFGESIRAQA